MKKLKFLLILALSALLLAACGGKDEDTDDERGGPISTESTQDATKPQDTAEIPSEDSKNESTEAPEPSSTVPDDDQPPREGMVRSRLTNEWVDEEVANTRPIAVMTPNESAAVPHYNLSRASILYEAPVEGSMTRMMAIYEDWEDLEKIGNVRSLRTYYGYWAMEWDAFIIHVGGPYFISEVLDKPDVQDLDEDHTAFFRSSDRKAPHNCYVSGPGIKEVIEKRNLGLEYRNLADEHHYKFAPDSAPNTLSQYSDAVDAKEVDMTGCYRLTRCYFKYNEEDGLYYRYQHLSSAADGPHIDAVTGEQLTFKNLLVQRMHSENLGEGYLAFRNHDTTLDGWYFTNGKGIHVNWQKTTDWGATRYYDDNGEEISLNTGKTMVMIIHEDDKVNYK